MTGIYAGWSRAYHAAGWSALLLPPRKKLPPPDGFTGRDGAYASRADVEAWCEERPDGNIAIRLPRGVIGVDADLYKPGAEQAWNDLVSRLGPLPVGPMTTSREEGSGIRWLRVPEDYEAVGKLPDDCGEVVQWFHRYVVAPPSVHPETGKPYKWLNVPDGHIPALDDLPVLPQAWVDRLNARPASTGKLPFQQPGDSYTHKSGWTNPDVDQLAVSGMQPGTQHDQMRDLVASLVGKGLNRAAVEAVWWTTVKRTTLHDPARWTQHYFDTTYDKAFANYGKPEADENEPAAGRQLLVTLASSIKPRPVRWLWPDRISLGSLTLLAGREGIGKSLVGVWLAAQLTCGTLPGSRYGTPSRVLFATSEDAWEFTMVPRLLAAGADLAMVGRVQVDDDGLTVGLTLPVDAAGLGTYMASHDVALLVLDPLTSVMDGRIDAHRDREVRTALEPLGQLAEGANAAVLGLVHLGKALSKDPVNLILGSRAFSAVARGALVAARDPDDEKSNVLSVEKSNLGRIDVPGLTYRIDGAEIATDEGMASAGLLTWTGETDLRVRDIMADADGDRSERDEAEEWLTSYLIDRNGEASAGDVLKAARADGIAPRTVQRARKRTGVTTAKASFGGGWVWQLDLRRRHEDAEGASTKDLASSAPSVAPSDSGWPAGTLGEEANQ